jgi:ATP synthase protein I
MPERPIPTGGRPASWDDAEDEAADLAFKRLSRDEAAALRAQDPPVSPWRVIAVQAAVGGSAVLIGWLVTGKAAVAWSLLYGAATVVIPSALMAFGMTLRFSSLSPGVSAVSVMLWESLKIALSIAMLLAATVVVPSLSWPALLVAVVLCIKVYWVALAWRARKTSR